MKIFYLRMFLMNILFCTFVVTGYSQEKTVNDTLLVPANDVLNPKPVKKVRKNSIMVNISNPLLISDQFRTIGYERVLPNNQSFTLNFGKFSIPKFTDGALADSLGINNDTKDKGFHFSTDYRFYLMKENRNAAPRGVYIAPYYTYNHLNRENSWNLEGYVDEVFTNLKLNVHTIGAELGYQFVFWDRVALDMILIGPGFGFYGVKAELGTNLNPEQEQEFFKKLNDILADKIPGYDRVIDAGEFSRTGNYSVKSIGYRYVIRVGYRF